MIQTPCEYMMWNGLPAIRKEIANSMVNNFGLTQKEAAKNLGITPAAVCQYLSKKRGNIKIVDSEILIEIDRSAEKIIELKEEIVISETCRICKILMKKGIFKVSCASYPKE